MQLMAGQTVEEILRHIQPDEFLRRDAIVYHGGIEIPKPYWARVRPKPGHHLDVIVTLHNSGGGKNPLRTVLSIALLATGALYGGALAGALGIKGFGAISAEMIGGALISFAGNLALSALIPPQTPKIGRLSNTNADTSQYFSIDSARNRERPWEKIPRLYGTHLLYGDMGAKSYTETDGDDQYLRGLIIWGYGPLSLSDFKIGETAIEQFEGVEIEHREGWDDDEPLTLFTRDVYEDSLAVALTQENGWIVRTTQPDTDEIGVEITLPSGLVEFDDRGERVQRLLRFEVEYAPAGTEEWRSAVAGIEVAEKSLTLKVPAPRTTLSWPYTPLPSAHIARVLINRNTGDISVIYGARGNTSSPPVPQTPSWAASLATIKVTVDGDGAVTSVEITDTRTATMPARENVGEFAVSSTGDLSLVVAGGTLYPVGIEIREKRPSEIRRSRHFPVPRGQYDVRVRRTTADTDDDKIFDKSFWSRLRSISNEDPVRFNKPVAKTAFRIKASGQLNNFVDTMNCIATSILPVYDADNDNWDTRAATSNCAAIARDILQGPATKIPLPDIELNLPSFEAFYLDCAERGFGYNAVIDYKTSVGALLDEACTAGRAFHHRPDGRVTIAMDRPQDVPVQHFTPANTWEFSGELSYPDLPHAIRVRFANAEKGWWPDMRSIFIDGYDEDSATEYQDTEMPGITDPGLIWMHGRHQLAEIYNRREKFFFWTDFESLQSTRGDLCLLTHDVPRLGLSSGRLAATSDNGTHVTSVTLDSPVVMQDGKEYVLRVVLPEGASLLMPVVTDDASGGVVILELVTPVPLAAGPHAGDLFMFGESEKECLQVLVRTIERGQGSNMRVTCIPYAPVVHEADEGEVPEWNSNVTGGAALFVPQISSVRSDGSVLLRDPDGSLANRILIGFDRPSSLFSGLRTIQARFREAESDGVWTYLSADADQGEIGLFPVEANIAYAYQLRWINADGRASEWSGEQTHVVIGKEARPSDVIRFSGQQNGDVCLFRWEQIPDLDAAGYDIRYIESTTTLTGDALWNNMTVLKEVERGDELTSAALPPGRWKAGIKARDTSGNASLTAKIITVDMLNAFDIIFQREAAPRWIGIKTDCLVHDVSGHLVPDDGALASGDDFDVFDQYRIQPPERFSYQSAEFDIGFDYANVRIWAERETALGPGESGVLITSLEVASALDGGDYGAFQDWTIGTQTARRFIQRLDVSLMQGTGSLVSFNPVVDIEEREEYGEISVSDSGDVPVVFSGQFARSPFIEITVNSDTPAFPSWHSVTGNGFSLSVYDAAGNRIVRPAFYRATGV